MKKSWVVAIIIACCPLVAMAVGRGEATKQIESSMLVKGTIETNADGSVSAATIDQEEKFPAGLVKFVREQIAAWKFEPVLVDGKPVRARNQMSVRVIVKKLDKDKFTIAIRSASFSGDAPKEGEALSSLKLTPPRYPGRELASGISGSVYLVVKVGPSGGVDDVVVEQVNLRAVGNQKEMGRWRNALADAALKVAKLWTFIPPAKGDQADEPYWLARIPVDFNFDRSRHGVYGKWEVYVPGPRQTVPWSDEERPGFSPDSLADGGIYMVGKDSGPKLLTPLDGT